MSKNVFIENGTYDVKSCSALEKPFYRPIEAAIRWCNLTAHEARILEVVGDDLLPKLTDFPQWPCLRVNAEKIIYATKNQELRHGRDGRNVLPDDHVAAHRVTVNHADLKKWMQEYFPDQKPAFLFDDIERNLHKSVTVETATALKAEIDVLKTRLLRAAEVYRELKNEKKTLMQKLEVYETKEMTTKDDMASLATIGALLAILNKHHPKKTQSNLIDEILEMKEAEFPHARGLSESQLQKIFPIAKKSFNNLKNQ